MTFAGFFAMFPALAFGRFCVRWHDYGIAAVCSGCAGALISIGLTALHPPHAAMLPGFALALVPALLSSGHSYEELTWQTEWKLRYRQLLPWGVAAAVLAGLTQNPLPLLPFAGVLAILSRLAWNPITDTVRCGMLLFLAAALGFAASGPLAPWTDWLQGLLCGICLCTAGFSLMPLAERLFPGWLSPTLFCLFVFLIFYYTNSIIPF